MSRNLVDKTAPSGQGYTAFEGFAWWVNVLSMCSGIIFIIVPIIIASVAPTWSALVFVGFSVICKVLDTVLNTNLIWMRDVKAIKNKYHPKYKFAAYFMGAMGTGLFATFLDKKSLFYHLLIFYGMSLGLSWWLGLALSMVYVVGNTFGRLKSLTSQAKRLFGDMKKLSGFQQACVRKMIRCTKSKRYIYWGRSLGYSKTLLGYLKTVIPVFVVLVLPFDESGFLMLKHFNLLNLNYDLIGVFIFAVYALIALTQCYENYLFTKLWYEGTTDDQDEEEEEETEETLKNKREEIKKIALDLSKNLCVLIFSGCAVGFMTVICPLIFGINIIETSLLGAILGKLGSALTGGALAANSVISGIIGSVLIGVILSSIISGIVLKIRGQNVPQRPESDLQIFVVIISNITQFFGLFATLIIFAKLVFPLCAFPVYWPIYLAVTVIAMLDTVAGLVNASRSIQNQKAQGHQKENVVVCNDTSISSAEIQPSKQKGMPPVHRKKDCSDDKMPSSDLRGQSL
jgi:hypothetical protein